MGNLNNIPTLKKGAPTIFAFGSKTCGLTETEIAAKAQEYMEFAPRRAFLLTQALDSKQFK